MVNPLSVACPLLRQHPLLHTVSSAWFLFFSIDPAYFFILTIMYAVLNAQVGSSFSTFMGSVGYVFIFCFGEFSAC